jgi:hypothetical protein
MPFIVQCPHRECRKFMLLEDSARGAKVECLVCKKPIEVDPSGSGDRPKPPKLPPEAGETVERVERQPIVNCPKCATPLRVPPGQQVKQLRCPRCSHVFAP